jgi:cytochrome c peroxidase
MRTILKLLPLLLLLASCDKDNPEPDFVGFVQPPHFPQPTYPMTTNPITKDGFELGKKLFYEVKLSRDGTISCGTCHIQYSAFTHHGHSVSHGIEDRLGNRNTPAVQNMAFMQTFFWDGGIHNLDMLPFAPIENPVEMDEDIVRVIEKLAVDPEYPTLFEKAFGSSEITSARLMQALSQFMLMLVSADTRYDDYAKGNTSALTSQEINGLAIFRQKCATCHSEPLFTDHSYRNNGLFRTNDKGRFQISLLSQDEYKFRVPSLRNLTYTAPYMHDGRFATIDQVLQHYQNGINAYPTLDPLLTQGIALTEAEKTDLKAFLTTLDDEKFIRDTRFSE